MCQKIQSKQNHSRNIRVVSTHTTKKGGLLFPIHPKITQQQKQHL